MCQQNMINSKKQVSANKKFNKCLDKRGSLPDELKRPVNIKKSRDELSRKQATVNTTCNAGKQGSLPGKCVRVKKKAIVE
eukprot:14217261-Ditylum_brightwellii.AAC.1